MTEIKKVLINWTDYGNRKTWHSPWGKIELEQCFYSCDRGKYVFKLLTYGLINHFLDPLLSCAYFFDQARAMRHLHSVIEVAQMLTDDCLNNLSISDAQALPLVGTSNQMFCCQTIELALKPINIPLIEFSAVARPKYHNSLVVDDIDRFPRYYLDRNIANLEMKDWMVAYR